jgi:hypothetical protein
LNGCVGGFCIALLLFGGTLSRVHSAELIAHTGEKQQRRGARAELVTVSGNHVSGSVLRVDCHGLIFDYLGNSLRVPLDKIAVIESAGDVPVSPRNGKDQITGRLSIRSGVVSVTTRDLGKVVLSIADFRCGGAAPADGTPAASAAPAGTLAGFEPSTGKMAVVLGKGADSPNETGINQHAAGGVSSAPQTSTPESPQTAPAAQTPTNASQSVTANPASTNAAPSSSGGPKIPQEQKEESERNALEFLRNEVVLVQPRKIEGDFSVSYLHTSQAIGNERIVLWGGQLRFGLFEGFEGFLAIPYVWGQRQNEAINTTLSYENAGIGDIRFGGKYNILQESVGIPVVVLGASAAAPTGHNPYLAPVVTTTSSGMSVVPQFDTRNPLEIQIGTGHWQLMGSLTALKSNDPLVLYATINYTHFIPATYYGVNIVPGNIWELNSAFGFSVNDTSTISAQVFIDYVEQWSFNNQSLPQTGTTPISLKLSYTQILLPTNLLQPSLTFGVTRDATDAVVSLDYVHRF